MSSEIWSRRDVEVEAIVGGGRVEQCEEDGHQDEIFLWGLN